MILRGIDLQALIDTRRDIHAHPELSRQEHRTTALVRDFLVRLGLAPRVLPTGTGVICDIENGDGPVVALRADLDALPLVDKKEVDYRSTVEGVCHACGHDAHTSILLGVANELVARKAEIHGTVRLLFQPAEEGVPSGSPDVIAAGGLEGVSMIYALHCDPQLPYGEVGYRFGPITTAFDAVDIEVWGQGGHSSRPHLTTDVIFVISRIVTDLPYALQQAGRWTSGNGAFMTFGAIKSGQARNALPAHAEARGGVRSLTQEAWNDLPVLLRNTVEANLGSQDVEWSLTHERVTPIVHNDDLATKILIDAVQQNLSDVRVTEVRQSLGSEDFGWYLQQVPGCLFRLGVRNPEVTQAADLHSGFFDIDERSMSIGVRTFVSTALQALIQI
jgi:amidohydrolase